MELKTPPGTRLILAAEDILETWGTRTEDGRRLTATWGRRHPEGWYEPTFTKTDDGKRLVDAVRLARALRQMTFGQDIDCDVAAEAIMEVLR